MELIGSWFFALALALWPQNVHIMCIPLNLMETHIEQYYLLGIDFKLEVNLFVIFTVNTRWLESRTSTASCANYVNAYYILCNGFGGGKTLKIATKMVKNFPFEGNKDGIIKIKKRDEKDGLTSNTEKSFEFQNLFLTHTNHQLESVFSWFCMRFSDGF